MDTNLEDIAALRTERTLLLRLAQQQAAQLEHYDRYLELNVQDEGRALRASVPQIHHFTCSELLQLGVLVDDAAAELVDALEARAR